MSKSFICFIFILGLFSQIIHAQNIKGKVLDKIGNPIELANIQIIEKNTQKSVFFSQTDSFGNFDTKNKNFKLPIILKVTHLSFESKEIEIIANSLIEIILENKEATIEEVVIKGKVFDVVERNDTIKYNLKKLLNGSENNLKDVIKKLPGLTIDEAGKIRYNGKKIDHLLLDGDDFYNDQHQIATENITSEMIAKIDVLKNYQDLSSIKGFENKGVTALNIGLNENFKNKIKGSIDAEGGYDEKYKLHSNIYNFNKKVKFNLITDANNVNYNVFTINDFIGIRKNLGLKVFNNNGSNSEIIQEEELPQFLFSNDLIKNKDVKNYTFNISSKAESKKYDFFSVLNKIKQVENKNIDQYFFGEFSPKILKNESNLGNSLFNANVFNFENKISENKYLKLNSYLIAGVDSQKTNLSNQINADILLFNNNIENKKIKFGINSSYKYKISNKLLFDAFIFNDINFNNNNLSISSNENLLQFTLNETNLIQKTNYQSISYGIKGKTTLKLKNSNFILNVKSLYHSESLKNKNFISQSYSFKNNFLTNENNISLVFNSKIKNTFRYSTGIEVANLSLSLSNRTKNNLFYILPNFDLSSEINKNLKISFSYNALKSDFSIYNLTSGKMINDYRTILSNSNLDTQKLLYNSYQFNLTYSKVSSNIFSVINFTINDLPKSINKSFINTNTLTTETYGLTDLNKSLYLILIGEKKFTSIPFGINIESLNSKITQKTIINSLENLNISYQNKVNFEIKSYFKNNNFNIYNGIEFLYSKSINDTNKNINKFSQFSPFTKINGLIVNDKLFWQLKSSLHHYNTTSTTVKNIFDFGFNLKYNLDKYSVFLVGNNIFNINSNNTKNSINYNQVYAEEIVMSSFSGYINLGINFTF